MRAKTFLLSVVITAFAIVILGISGFADAATVPAATFLGYNTLPGGAPARIATDNIGRLYVTDSNSNSVRIYSNNGVFLGVINVERPLGVAVDQLGRIYVGSTATGSVSVFNGIGKFMYKLGSGNGEFGMPNDIAVSSAGTVYVTDSAQNLIKAYSSAGAFLFSFGSVELITFPTGIAIDDAAGEVYVSGHVNKAVFVYNMNGVFQRYVSNNRRTCPNVEFFNPQGLALDSTRLYIVDAFNHTIAVFAKDGTCLGYVGHYGEGALGELITPLDAVIDRDSKLFITNHNSGRVELAGIDTYTLFNVNPGTLSFSIPENGSPVTKTVSLSSMGNAVSWVASTTNSWVSVSPSAGTTPENASITVNPSGLGIGSYSAQVMFTMPSGTAAMALVNLEVKSQVNTLRVAPATVNLRYLKGSQTLPSSNISISTTGENVSWTATKAANWIKLSSAAGTTPSNITVEAKDDIKTFNLGTYNTKVTVNAGSIEGSPAIVNVTLAVINAGKLTVTTNLEQATFEIKGPTNYSGSGTNWSAEEAMPGNYSITFGHVSGYIKPPAQTFKIKSGEEKQISVEYKIRPVATNIIAGSGVAGTGKIAVLGLDGIETVSFVPFESPRRIRVAAGDIDGNGLDEIVTTDNKKNISAYTPEGIKLDSLAIPLGFNNAVIAVKDINHNGKADIIAGFKGAVQYPRKIKLIKYTSEGVLKKGLTLYSEAKDGEFTIALGDINGDGLEELIMADIDSVRAFSINLNASGKKLIKLWNKSVDFSSVPEVAAGDIDNDGITEIALSGEKAGVAEIKILKGTGEDYGLTINAFGDLGCTKPSTVALGDVDTDGEDEILAGAGHDASYEPLIRIFDKNGELIGTTMKAMENNYGVNISFGKFK